MSTSPRHLKNAFAVVALTGALMAGTPSLTRAEDAPVPTTQTAMTNVSTAKVLDKATTKDRVEKRIATLHTKLMISKEQETNWSGVADAMRANEEATNALIIERHNNAATMSAIDDLKSYEAIAKAHVDGLDKVIVAFEPLYDSMSDDQKKNADNVFGKFEGHRNGHKAHTSQTVK